MRNFFRATIALVLIGLYVYLVFLAVNIIYTGGTFTDCMARALSIIGGLVSALVITELAITPAGQSPIFRAFESDSTSKLGNFCLYCLSAIYLVAWIVAGLTSFIVGLFHPQEVPALATVGNEWLGLAVTAAYAYFGIKPNEPKKPSTTPESSLISS